MLMSRVIMIRPSGVIWGLTFNDRLAFRKATLVAPELVACW